jgi:DNA-binding beta-propeller fold protein YncE
MTGLQIRRRVVIHSRRAIDRGRSIAVPVARRVWAPVDRRRHPARPAGISVLDDQVPEMVVASGRYQFASGQKRYATASDVVWLSPTLVAVAYLLTSTVVVFDFDDADGTPRLTERARFAAQPGISLPSAVASAEGLDWLAVTNSGGGSISFVSYAGERGRLSAVVRGTASIPGDKNIHGLAVAPDARFVAYTSIDDPGGVRVVAAPGPGDGHELEVVSMLVNPHAPQKPKGVRFSPDGRFLVIAYGGNVSRSRRRLKSAFVEVHAYDMATGSIGEFVSRSPESLHMAAGEAVAFFPDGSAIVVTDQVDDTAQVVEFDRATGRLGDVTQRFGWAAGGLTFAHGCAVSPDQRWIAVTNYGDASIRFFASNRRAVV